MSPPTGVTIHTLTSTRERASKPKTALLCPKVGNFVSDHERIISSERLRRSTKTIMFYVVDWNIPYIDLYDVSVRDQLEYILEHQNIGVPLLRVNYYALLMYVTMLKKLLIHETDQLTDNIDTASVAGAGTFLGSTQS
ncbi:hypothetical protein J6590_057635 [Homalodisca vitripennis]|nr:hypothetical protein J6590_057635 [Homalodisca vitripennis]